MKSIVKVFFVVIILLSAMTIFFISSNKIPSLDECQSIIYNEKSFVTPEAEKSSLDCYVKVISEKAKSETPSLALDYLFEYVNSSNSEHLNIDCHSIIHSIGYAFYDQYKEKSLIADKEQCNYGYYHGVFQKAIELKLNNYNKFMDIICKSKEGGDLLFCRAAVSHGYGHSVATGNPDYLQGLSICDQIYLGIGYSQEEENCAYGYFMEKIRDLTYNFTPENCLEASNSSLIRGCLTMIASLMVRNGKDMSEGCPIGLFTAFESKMCYRGYGYAVGEKILNYEKNNEDNYLPFDVKLFSDCNNNEFCLSGAGSMLGSYFQHNLKIANDLCSQYLPLEFSGVKSNRAENNICFQSVKSTQKLTDK
jgi:hypothetical protein